MRAPQPALADAATEAADGRTSLRPNRPLDATTQSKRPAPRAQALGAVYVVRTEALTDIPGEGLCFCEPGLPAGSRRT